VINGATSTAGIDLCRKKFGKTVYGLTLPLITNTDGSKFGKTAAGAVWLDPKRTSVYRFLPSSGSIPMTATSSVI